MATYRRPVVLILATLSLAVVPWRTATAYDYRVPILIDDEDDLRSLQETDEISYEEFDRLLNLLQDPLDLNSASRNDLYDLPDVTYELAEAIIKHRKEKPFGRVTELKRVAGITDDIFKQVRPFVRVVKPAAKAERKKGKVRSTVRLKGVDRISPTDREYPETYASTRVEQPGVFDVGVLAVNRNAAGFWNNGMGEYGFQEDKDDDPQIILWKFETDGSVNVDSELSEKEGTTIHQTEEFEGPYLTTKAPKKGRSGWPYYSVAWPKLYARFNWDKAKLILGSYTVGFGQRLVFDSTGRENPHGGQADIVAFQDEKGFKLSPGQFGAVSTIRPVRWLDFSLFGSWKRYDTYYDDLQHQVDDHTTETYSILQPYEATGSPYYEDTLAAADFGECGDGHTQCYRKLLYQNLGEAWTEVVGGANVTFSFLDDSHVGLTGYVGWQDFHLGDPDTIFARSSGHPQRDLFGAWGVDFAFNLRKISIFGEAAMNDIMGFAGILRAVIELKDVTLEPVYRHYTKLWDNPHSRGKAQPGQLDGSNDRGEHGLLLSLKYRPSKAKWLALRFDTDIFREGEWIRKLEGHVDEIESKDDYDNIEYYWRLNPYLKLDFFPLREVNLSDRIKEIKALRLGLFFEYTDKDLTKFGFDEDYTRYSDGCSAPAGERYAVGIQSSIPLPQLRIDLFYRAAFLSAPQHEKGVSCTNDYDYKRVIVDGDVSLEHYVYAKIRFTPLGYAAKKLAKYLALDLKLKYFDGQVTDVAGTSSAEEYFEEYVQLCTYPEGKRLAFGGCLRGAARQYLNDKDTEWFWKATAQWDF